MRIRLEVDENKLAIIKEKLEQAGFVITEDDEDYILLQKDLYVSHLTVRNSVGDKVHMAVEDIIYMESYGHSIDVVSDKGRFQSSEPLKNLLTVLDSTMFVRISNSVIINRRKLKEIIPSFSMKFRLRMSNGDIVEVTRSYYNSFREYFRI